MELQTPTSGDALRDEPEEARAREIVKAKDETLNDMRAEASEEDF